MRGYTSEVAGENVSAPGLNFIAGSMSRGSDGRKPAVTRCTQPSGHAGAPEKKKELERHTGTITEFSPCWVWGNCWGKETTEEMRDRTPPVSQHEAAGELELSVNSGPVTDA